jgi:hypothetical protein
MSKKIIEKKDISTIINEIKDYICDSQTNDFYSFGNNSISWNSGLEQYCLIQPNKTDHATPNHLSELLEFIPENELRKFYKEEVK